MRDPNGPVDSKVTIVGAGPLTPEMLDRALSFAPYLIAADGGANHLRDRGLLPQRIIGDIDSLTNIEFWRDNGTEITHISEQESTDFEKSLREIEAGLYVGVGFLGGRIDHELAALHCLVANPDKRIILLGSHDVAFLMRGESGVEVPAGSRVSFFPMRDCQGVASSGLRWPIDALSFGPGTRIGTSNETTMKRFSAAFDHPVMITILPAEYLSSVVAALCD